MKKVIILVRFLLLSFNASILFGDSNVGTVKIEKSNSQLRYGKNGRNGDRGKNSEDGEDGENGEVGWLRGGNGGNGGNAEDSISEKAHQVLNESDESILKEIAG